MATMFMLPAHATNFEPIHTGSEDEYRQTMIIAYAWKTYRYVITPQEAHEIIHGDLWEDVDDFVAYMWGADFGEVIPNTTNVKIPSIMRVYTSEELDLMDAGLFVGEDRSRRPSLARLGPSDETNGGEAGSDGDDEDGISLKPNSSTTMIDQAPFEDFEYEELGWLPAYTPEMPPSYTSCVSSDPLGYSLEMAVEAVGEDEVVPHVEITLIGVGSAPFYEVKEAIISDAKTDCASDEKRTGIFSFIGTHINRKIRKTKRKVTHVLRMESSNGIFKWS